MLADSRTSPKGPIYAVFIRQPEGGRKLWKNTEDKAKADLEVQALKVHGFDAQIIVVGKS